MDKLFIAFWASYWVFCHSPQHSLKKTVARYASVATNADIKNIYKEKDINIPAHTSIDKCPHTLAARAATCIEDELATATATKDIQRRMLLQVAALFTRKSSLRLGNTSTLTMRLSTKKSLIRNIRTSPIVMN